MSESIYFWKINQKYGEFSQWFISTFSDGENEYNCCEQYMSQYKVSFTHLYTHYVLRH